MNEEKNQKLFAVVLVILVIALGIYKIFFANTKVKEAIDTEKISIVKDENRFFTVSNCASSYINYLAARDTDNLLILFSDNFKKDNNITSSNLYDFVDEIDGNYSFSARKMYEQRISKTIYKYYVYGVLNEQSIDSLGNSVDYYLVIIIDEKNTTFAVEPYDGEIFNK